MGRATSATQSTSPSSGRAAISRSAWPSDDGGHLALDVGPGEGLGEHRAMVAVVRAALIDEQAVLVDLHGAAGAEGTVGVVAPPVVDIGVAAVAILEEARDVLVARDEPGSVGHRPDRVGLAQRAERIG